MVTTTADRRIYLRDREVGRLFDGVFVRWAKPFHFFDGLAKKNRQMPHKGWAYHFEVLSQLDDAEFLAVTYRSDLFVAEFKQAFGKGIPFSSQYGQQLLIPLTAWQRIQPVPPNASIEVIASLARRGDLCRPVPADWTVEGWQERLLPLEEEP